MRTSQAGIDLICQAEGYSGVQYLCPAGKPTIGYGHCLQRGEHFDEPMTQSEALALLLVDLPIYEAQVLGLVEVELTQGQFDALVSFTYNLGPLALEGSTLLRFLNEGKYQYAADEFPRWCHATVKGVRTELPGLVARRAAERALFLSGGLT